MACLGALSIARAASPSFSPWRFDAYKAPSGKNYCSLISAVANKNIGQNVVIKMPKGGEHLVVDLYKDQWNRPRGSAVKVMFDFANNNTMQLVAYADAHILDVEIPVQYTADFLLELSRQPVLQAIFPDEGEDTWTITGSGAKPEVQKFVACLRSK